MYIEATPEAALAEPEEFSPTHFWCNLTQTPVGPDDRPVGQDRCNSCRSCFEE